MNAYRITIETMNEQYEYEYVEDCNSREEARERGLALAVEDGMDAESWYDIRIEELL